MKRSQSKWSSSTHSRSEGEQASPSPVKMAEGSQSPRYERTCSPDIDLTRICKTGSPPMNSENFQTLQSEPGSIIELMPTPPPAFLSHTNSSQSFATTMSTRPIRSNRRPSQSNKSMSKLRPKPRPTPSIQPGSELEPTQLPRSPQSNASSSTLAGGASFELTPLSGLIAQSYTDIKLLRRLHNAHSPTYPSPTYSHDSSAKDKHKNEKNRDEKAGPPRTSPQVQQSLIDFDRVEDNLRKFEEMYRQFLNYGGKYGDKAEEVHLVAVVCKRSDVVKGNVGTSDESVPRLQRVWVDCGL